MSENKFTPEPLFVHDGSHIIDGKRVGTLDILNREQHEEGYKWIGDVKPYGNTFPDYEEAKAYAKLFAASPDMRKAIKLALSIKDLWAPVDYPSVEHEGEAQALQSMLTAFESAIAKSTA